jgi:hypothetical protein
MDFDDNEDRVRKETLVVILGGILEEKLKAVRKTFKIIRTVLFIVAPRMLL